MSSEQIREDHEQLMIISKLERPLIRILGKVLSKIRTARVCHKYCTSDKTLEEMVTNSNIVVKEKFNMVFTL